MIKEMMMLPEDHDAWAYVNPSMFYFDRQTSSEEIIEKGDQYVRDFKID
jgi:hypothetical protein